MLQIGHRRWSEEVMRCQERIWDNGDMTDCGAPVLRLDKCAWHVEEEVRRLREANVSMTYSIKQNELRIDALMTHNPRCSNLDVEPAPCDCDLNTQKINQHNGETF